MENEIVINDENLTEQKKSDKKKIIIRSILLALIYLPIVSFFIDKILGAFDLFDIYSAKMFSTIFAYLTQSFFVLGLVNWGFVKIWNNKKLFLFGWVPVIFGIFLLCFQALQNYNFDFNTGLLPFEKEAAWLYLFAGLYILLVAFPILAREAFKNIKVDKSQIWIIAVLPMILQYGLSLISLGLRNDSFRSISVYSTSLSVVFSGLIFYGCYYLIQKSSYSEVFKNLEQKRSIIILKYIFYVATTYYIVFLLSSAIYFIYTNIKGFDQGLFLTTQIISLVGILGVAPMMGGAATLFLFPLAPLLVSLLIIFGLVYALERKMLITDHIKIFFIFIVVSLTFYLGVLIYDAIDQQRNLGNWNQYTDKYEPSRLNKTEEDITSNRYIFISKSYLVDNAKKDFDMTDVIVVSNSDGSNPVIIKELKDPRKYFFRSPSPRGTYYIRATLGSGNASVMNLDEKEVFNLPAELALGDIVRWSFDEKYLARIIGDSIVVYDIRKGEKIFEEEVGYVKKAEYGDPISTNPKIIWAEDSDTLYSFNESGIKIMANFNTNPTIRFIETKIPCLGITPHNNNFFCHGKMNTIFSDGVNNPADSELTGSVFKYTLLNDKLSDPEIVTTVPLEGEYEAELSMLDDEALLFTPLLGSSSIVNTITGKVTLVDSDNRFKIFGIDFAVDPVYREATIPIIYQDSIKDNFNANQDTLSQGNLLNNNDDDLVMNKKPAVQDQLSQEDLPINNKNLGINKNQINQGNLNGNYNDELLSFNDLNGYDIFLANKYDKKENSLLANYDILDQSNKEKFADLIVYVHDARSSISSTEKLYNFYISEKAYNYPGEIGERLKNTSYEKIKLGDYEYVKVQSAVEFKYTMQLGVYEVSFIVIAKNKVNIKNFEKMIASIKLKFI